MRKMRISALNSKYIIACHIKINKGTKVFYLLYGAESFLRS